jgi:AraC family transcriptional regulator
MTNQNRTSEGTILQLDPPRFETGKPMLVAGLRGHFTPATWAGIPAQWERLITYETIPGKIPGKVGFAHYGLCFNLSGGFDYLCGVEVAGVAGLPSEFSHVNIPAQRCAVFAHHEHVFKLRNTLDAIQHWFPGSGHEVARPAGGAPDFFERYGEGFNPETGRGDVDVWVPIKS